VAFAIVRLAGSWMLASGPRVYLILVSRLSDAWLEWVSG